MATEAATIAARIKEVRLKISEYTKPNVAGGSGVTAVDYVGFRESLLREIDSLTDQLADMGYTLDESGNAQVIATVVSQSATVLYEPT